MLGFAASELCTGTVLETVIRIAVSRIPWLKIDEAYSSHASKKPAERTHVLPIWSQHSLEQIGTH